MRVLLAPFGSRGDVAPMLALGQALRARGHPVLVAPPGDMASLVRLETEAWRTNARALGAELAGVDGAAEAARLLGAG